MSAGCEVFRIGQRVVDDEIIEILVVRNIFSGQGCGALGPSACVSFLIVVLEVRKVSCESPGRAAVHIGRGECIEAELCCSGMNVFRNCLEACEVLELIHGMACFFDEIRVHDNAVALIAVTDRNELAGFVIQIVGIGAQFIGDRCSLEIHCIVFPLLDTGLVADDEECRLGGLVHFRCQCLAVRTGSRCHNLYVNPCLRSVVLCEPLQCFVKLRLEVQEVNRTLAGITAGASACRRWCR